VEGLGHKQFKEKNPDEALKDTYKLMEGKDPATTGVTASEDGAIPPWPMTLPS
jgi:hypothetical protein